MSDDSPDLSSSTTDSESETEKAMDRATASTIDWQTTMNECGQEVVKGAADDVKGAEDDVAAGEEAGASVVGML